MSTKSTPKVLRVKGVGLYRRNEFGWYLVAIETYGKNGNYMERTIAEYWTLQKRKVDGEVSVDCTITIHPGKRGKR